MPAHTLVPGFHPFWFWNGRIEREEMLWQMGEMAKQGCKGFFIHSRQGLAQPYLGREFLDLVRCAVGEAPKLGLCPHLYDECPYPSGAAGGAVTLGEPSLWATRLSYHRLDAQGGPVTWSLPPGKLVSLQAIAIDEHGPRWSQPQDLTQLAGVVLTRQTIQSAGTAPYISLRYFACEPCPVLETVLPPGDFRLIACIQEVIHWHKYIHHPPDVLNPHAIARFLELTHKRYADHFPDLIGSVGSMFTDEIEPAWSPLLIPAYRECYAEELPPVLLACHEPGHPRHHELNHRLHHLRLALFEASFERPVAAWCQRHHVRYSGEKPSLRLSQLRYMDIPGCEPGHTKAGAGRHDLLRANIRQNARATASASYFYGKEGSLCECFHSLGWGTTLQDLRLISDSLLLMGIRYLVPHGCFYTTHGLVRHDAPPSIFFQMPWWPMFHHLALRVDRILAHLERTHIDAQIVIIEPTAGLPDERQKHLYEALQQGLMSSHHDFLMVDTDILEGGVIADGAVLMREVTARLVVVPPMATREEALVAWLRRFRSAGGAVVEFSDATSLAGALATITALVAPALPCRGENHDQLLITRYRDATGERFLVINPSSKPCAVTISRSLREIPLDGEQSARLVRTEDGCHRLLAGFEAIALIPGTPPEAASLPALVHLDLSGASQMHRGSANVVWLGQWRMSLPDSDVESALVEAMPVIEQLHRSGLAYSPHLTRHFGLQPRLDMPPLRVLYTTEIRIEHPVSCILVVEPGGISGAWQITLDGGGCYTQSDLTESDAHVRGSLQLALGMLGVGIHHLTLQVHCTRFEDGLLTPLLLAGDFAVELDPTRVVATRHRGWLGEPVRNGLPFYDGQVVHELDIDLDLARCAASAVEFALDLPAHCEDAVELSCNGHAWHAMPWSPRRVLIPLLELTHGANRIRLRCLTSRLRSFEGRWFDTLTHHTRSIEPAAVTRG